MLAVFEKSIGKPPAELNLPSTGSKKSKSRQEIAEIFQILWPETILCNISNGNFMGLSHENESPLHPRSLVVMDDIFCMFIGTLENICELKRHYGLSRQATEAMVLIEAYKVLRDRAPYPPDQVVKDLQGKFAFILFDAKSHTLFAARDCDGGVDLNWGIAGDGSLICSNDSNLMKEACGISCASFPPGCMFMNGTGLMSFVHPLHKVRAIVHEDDGRQIRGVSFQVDLYTRLPSIPRSGSAANWADATAVEAE
ncbi:hypothetical protein CICLE_v10018115mg [Citrus x clementina]|uniref:DUF3700 domain-containing protein n=1 Tax=Citrus clementina TaxID=85681 RepID=V4W8L5_CITCL|nr:stem-specific protein TSJT1 isoform X1 [Citrus x clementina]ESR62564.1 hypothetical protein CICLE_v10018115mg [Citrus x clementina]